MGCPYCGVNQADLVISPCNHILCTVCLTTLQIQHLNFKPVKTSECPYCSVPIQEFKQIPSSTEQAPALTNTAFPWPAQNWAVNKPGMYPTPPLNGKITILLFLIILGQTVPNGFGAVPVPLNNLGVWSTPIVPENPNPGYFVYPSNLVNTAYPSIRPLPNQTWTNQQKLPVPGYSIPSLTTGNPWLSNTVAPYPPQYVQSFATETLGKPDALAAYNPTVNVQPTNPQKK
jgi:hypothetical protein